MKRAINVPDRRNVVLMGIGLLCILVGSSEQAFGSATETAGAEAAHRAAMSAADSKARMAEAQLMAKLDDMDFNIFSNKQWNRIKESHAQNIWVDSAFGVTTGLPVHIDGMRGLAVFMPDMRITAHPVKVADGKWTGITAVFEGTFSAPMPNPNGGAAIPATGRAYRGTIATISHWVGGLMDKEYVFMDMGDFTNQIGITQGPVAKDDPGFIPFSGVNANVSPAEMQRRMAVLDNMDFVVWSGQQWDKIPESHADNIIAIYPDGKVSRGIARHVEDMKAIFNWAPDSRIREHPVKFGQGDWTVLIGVMEGTFTKPMTMADGRVVEPTGKTFKVPMATYSHWNNAGKMDMEYLFWDTTSWMKQLGVNS